MSSNRDCGQILVQVELGTSPAAGASSKSSKRAHRWVSHDDGLALQEVSGVVDHLRALSSAARRFASNTSLAIRNPSPRTVHIFWLGVLVTSVFAAGYMAANQRSVRAALAAAIAPTAPPAVIAAGPVAQGPTSSTSASGVVRTAPVVVPTPLPPSMATPLPADPGNQADQPGRTVVLRPKAPVGSVQQRGDGASSPVLPVGVDEQPNRGVAAARPTPAHALPAVRLVAIATDTTIAVTDPKTGLPISRRIGETLPDGSTLKSIDMVSGTATTSTGKRLALE